MTLRLASLAQGRARLIFVAAFAASFGLVVYDSWFLRKTRTL